MADYQKVGRGDSPFTSPAFTASWQNEVSDMLAWYRRNKASGEGGGSSGPLESSSGIVKVKNLTGDDLLRGNYVQLGDYLLTDVDHHKHWFDGNLYDAAENGRIAILERAVKSDDTSIVRARILGKCTARVDVTDVDHRFAAPVDGASLLKSAASGSIEILSISKITGTGEQELAVLLGGGGTIDLVFGKTTSAITAATDWDLASAGTGTFAVVADDGTAGSNVDIVNRYFDEIPINIPGWVLDGTWIGLNFGCNAGPS